MAAARAKRLAMRRAEPTFHRFLDLPPELRNQIYSYYLSFNDPIRVGPSTNDLRGLGVLNSTARSITQVCRQMRNEGVTMYFGGNSFLFLIEDPKLVQIEGRDQEYAELNQEAHSRWLIGMGQENLTLLRHVIFTSGSHMDNSQALVRVDVRIDEVGSHRQSPSLTVSAVFLDRHTQQYLDHTEVVKADMESFVKSNWEDRGVKTPTWEEWNDFYYEFWRKAAFPAFEGWLPCPRV